MRYIYNIYQAKCSVKSLTVFSKTFAFEQAACRVLPSLPLPVGVHRFASDANARTADGKNISLLIGAAMN